MNIEASINHYSDRFTVWTKTKLFLFNKPHTSVMPFLINGKWTPERGFQVHYSTSDEAVLQRLHDQFCLNLSVGEYSAMRELIRANQSTLKDLSLAQFITGFKY